MAITAYRLLSCWSREELNSVIHTHIKEGWEPFGSPIITANPDRQTAWDRTSIYAQAVILRDD